jgi:hypothetical protein
MTPNTNPTERQPARPDETRPALAPAPGLPAELWLDDLQQATQAPKSWLLQGYLAPGNVTVLTSQWKSGKSTLLSVLLARLKTGGLLAGLPVAPGKAAVLSEESAEQWLARSRKLDFAGHVCWYCRPFAGKPTHDQWLALLDRLTEVHARHGLHLVAIDSLAHFFPGRGESNAEIMLEFLMPLRRLTALGLCVLLLHHPAKAETAAGCFARGSGALSGFADILIEQHWYTRADDADRRRRLLAFSRYEETPRQLVIELNADGTDYLGHGSFLEEEFMQSWTILRAVLADAPRKLTRRQVARSWPPDAEAPAPATLWRWLERAVGQGLMLREGSGRRRDPFRYWLPGQEEQWKVPRWQKELEALNERLMKSDGPLPEAPP